MKNSVSSADKQAMVASFLQVAVGQTTDTAHEFLMATKWKIEDALQLFYMGIEKQKSASSPYIPPPAYSVLLSAHNPSGLEGHIRNACTIQPATPVSSAILLGSTAPVPPITTPAISFPIGGMPHMVAVSCSQMSPAVSMSPPSFIPAPPAQFIMRRKRRTKAEIATAASGLVTPVLAELVPCRRRRTQAEIHAAASSSTNHRSLPASALPRFQHPKQTHAKVALAVWCCAYVSYIHSNDIYTCSNNIFQCPYDCWSEKTHL